MIEIKIPKEIRKYKEKLFLGLTARQFIWTVIAIVINVPLYWYGRDVLGEDVAGWGVIILSFPIFAMGYFEYNGLTFENFIGAFIRNQFLYPQKRVYESENDIKELVNCLDIKNGSKEKKNKKIKEKKGGDN